MRRNHYGDEWYKTALYEVWRDMMKRARVLCRGFNDEFPVDPIFRDFAKFRMWANFAYPKRGDDWNLCRRDKTQFWSPENCYFSRVIPEYFEGEARVTPGAKARFKESKPPRTTHGLSRTRLYNIWRGMIRRCTIPNCKDYPDYGGRGIIVCDEWRFDFMKFWDWAWNHGYDPELSIDRMDVNGNYCPENCRWASNLEQTVNVRAYANKYRNVRLKVEEMRTLLQSMPDGAVVTLVARSDFLPDVIAETDFEAIPENEREDRIIGAAG